MDVAITTLFALNVDDDNSFLRVSTFTPATDAQCQAYFQRREWDSAEQCYETKMRSYKEKAFYRIVAQYNLARVLNIKGGEVDKDKGSSGWVDRGREEGVW